MAVVNHTHTYIRLVKKPSYKESLYRCFDPHCTDKKPGLELVGKACLCNICHREFILKAEDLKRSRPRCAECSETREARTRRAASNLVFDIFSKVQAQKTEDIKTNES